MKKIIVVKCHDSSITAPVTHHKTLNDLILEIDALTCLMDIAEMVEEIRKEEREKKASYVRSHRNFLHDVNGSIRDVEYMDYGGREFALILSDSQIRHVDITGMSNVQISKRLMEVSVAA